MIVKVSMNNVCARITPHKKTRIKPIELRVISASIPDTSANTGNVACMMTLALEGKRYTAKRGEGTEAYVSRRNRLQRMWMKRTWVRLIRLLQTTTPSELTLIMDNMHYTYSNVYFYSLLRDDDPLPIKVHIEFTYAIPSDSNRNTAVRIRR